MLANRAGKPSCQRNKTTTVDHALYCYNGSSGNKFSHSGREGQHKAEVIDLIQLALSAHLFVVARLPSFVAYSSLQAK